ncbi:MAG TPA: SDR family oxidoreductase [Elusimicrobiales bacterium]|nr:SDR family oxidoreductase [Elusimicrobiales bacterium]
MGAHKKTVLVLGGRGDIGTAICKRLRAEGYAVEAPASSELDLSDKHSIDRYFSRKKPAYWGIVHSAGYNEPKPYQSLTASDIGKTFAVNTLGFFEVLRHALAAMRRRGGSIVAISSLYGTFAQPGRLPYVMSKHALNGLVKTLALELGPHGIVINSVSPGFVDTKMTRKNNSAATLKSFRAKIPLGRLASASDVAYAVSFLLSPQNRYITGQDIVSDGGYSAGGFQQ